MGSPIAIARRFGFRTACEKTIIQRQIEAADSQIDRLVYELYGLTDKEIGIVEATAVSSTNSRSARPLGSNSAGE